MSKKKIIFITILILFISYITYVNYFNQNKCFITINDSKFKVTLAIDPVDRARGLSGTKSLAPNAGKLFVFEQLDLYGFWMKDMNYAIDIIWFDENWTISGLAKNVAPETYPKVFYPEFPSKYVLEINAGLAEKYNLDFNTKASLSCTTVLK